MTEKNQIIEKRANKMIGEYMFFFIHELLPGTYEELKKTFHKKDYQGTYDFDITFKDGTTSINEFVYLMKCSDEKQDAYGLLLQPMYCSNEKIYEYYENRLDDTWIDQYVEKIEVGFLPIERYKKHDPNELIIMGSSVEKIMPTDKYVTVDGVNYQVVTTPVDEDGIPLQLHIKKEELEEEIWEEIEKDNFMGRIKRTFVNQIGEFIEEESIITSMENNTIHCLDYKIPPINSNNIPLYMTEEKYNECHFEEDDENGVRLCFVPIDFQYIPYSLDEEL